MDVKWLTIEEICDRLQLHPQTVRRWLREGELHGVLIGDRAGYRVHPEDLLAFLVTRGYSPQPGRDAGRHCNEESQ